MITVFEDSDIIAAGSPGEKMTKSPREVESIIRKLCADHNVCDPKGLISFAETNNLEVEVEKRDGSSLRIRKRLLERIDKDPVAKLELLKKLKGGFKKPKKRAGVP